MIIGDGYFECSAKKEKRVRKKKVPLYSGPKETKEFVTHYVHRCKAKCNSGKKPTGRKTVKCRTWRNRANEPQGYWYVEVGWKPHCT